MPKLPRLVVLHVAPNADASCTIAMLAALHRGGYQVQHFRSIAAFALDHATPVTGIASRHVDPWIMDEAMCRQFFVKNAKEADLSLIEAQGGSAGDAAAPWRQIARTLNAPVIAVIPADASHAPPQHVDGVWIDGFTSLGEFRSVQSSIARQFGVSVLGGLAAGHPGRECLDRLRHGRRIPGNLLDALSTNLLQVTRLETLLALADSRPFPPVADEPVSTPHRRGALRVAIPYDPCFHCYFPDTLDALEFHGAELREFSPLSDERLPDDVDLLYMGCGHPESFARRLALNECMRAAIREYVGSGRRVYAEGGAAAYLCREIQLADGTAFPMVGVFPTRAEFSNAPAAGPQPVTIRCERSNWIAERGDCLRGYRNGTWRFDNPAELVPCFVASEPPHAECVIRHHCVGSMVHLNFAAQPQFLERFFAPHAPSLSL